MADVELEHVRHVHQHAIVVGLYRLSPVRHERELLRREAPQAPVSGVFTTLKGRIYEFVRPVTILGHLPAGR